MSELNKYKMKTFITAFLLAFLAISISQVYADAMTDQQAGSIIQNATAYVNDIEPYTGFVPPDSPFYEVKLTLEDLDERLTFNETDRLNKRIKHARTRISEAKAEMRKNKNLTAEKAMNRYLEKSAEIDDEIEKQENKSTGLHNAQAEILKHQLVLKELSDEHPDNIGLQRALNNTKRMEERFENKTAIRYTKGIVVKRNQSNGNG